MLNFQGGKSTRIVNCVLALKSYSDWKQSGGIGTWKYGGNLKPPTSGSGKPFMRKTTEPFMNSFSRTSSMGSASSGDQCLYDELGHDLNEVVGDLCCFSFYVIFVILESKARTESLFAL